VINSQGSWVRKSLKQAIPEAQSPNYDKSSLIALFRAAGVCIFLLSMLIFYIFPNFVRFFFFVFPCYDYTLCEHAAFELAHHCLSTSSPPALESRECFHLSLLKLSLQTPS
jgi:hypothetical protein